MSNRASKRILGILNCLIPLILAFSVGAIVILFVKENPLEVYGILIKQSLLKSSGFANTLHYASPLILTGLAIAVAFKANIYNMGVEGSLILGGFITAIVGSSLPDAYPIGSKIICISIGALAGIAYALVIAFLKVRFRANEMVVSMMLNYALAKFLEYLTCGPFKDIQTAYVTTKQVTVASMFKRLFQKPRLTLFFFAAVIILIIMYILMKKTKLGYAIDAMGKNYAFTEAIGIDISKMIYLIMIISGALGGIAGSGWCLADQYRYTLDFSKNPGLGWDGMLIALLGGHDPIGILVAAIFYAALKTGSDKINMYSNVPKEIIAMIQALIILFLAVKFVNDQTGFLAKIRKQKSI